MIRLLLALSLGLTNPALSQPTAAQLYSAQPTVTALTQSSVPRPLIKASLTKTTQSPASGSVSAAQDVFNQVNSLIQTQYGGLSTVDRPALSAEYQKRLDAVCAPTPATCAAEKAYPVLSAEINALGDEHSYFELPSDFEDFVTSATGGDRLQFGVRLAPLDGQNRLVLEIIPGSASEESGLQRGDVLKTIDAQPYTYEALRSARDAGRTIQVGLERKGAAQNLSLTPRQSSTRDLPRLSFLPAATGQSGQVAVIRIPTFLSGGSVAQTVHQNVRQAQDQKAAGIIVDLRGNTGGDLTECDGSASAFVPSFTRLARTPQGSARTVVRGGSRLDDGRVRSGIKSPTLWTGPLTVMVDAGSASCSEFFAYEMQYAKRATILGENTAGVGNTATRVFPVGSGAALQLTILNYAKPDGTPYPVRVKPDVSAATDLTALASGTDTLLGAALSALKSAPVLNANSVSDDAETIRN
jgi:carboxyl-terminal processing protease